MSITQSVSQQVLIMLCLIIVGFILFKAKLISEKGTKDFSELLLTTVTPCVLISAYQTDRELSVLKELGTAFLMSLILHIVFIAVSYLVFLKTKNPEKKKFEIFTSVYSNCGFMGIPLLSAALGEKGVLLGSAYLAVFNIIVWTHGLYLYSGNIKLLSIKKLFKNPGVMGTVSALVLFFFNIRLGGSLKASVDYLAALITPLAMLLLGSYLARADLKSAFRHSSLYAAGAMKLLILPIIGIFIFKLCGIEPFLATALSLSAACPAATISALFAEKFEMDTGLPSQIVSVTTLVSVVTLPVIAWICSAVL